MLVRRLRNPRTVRRLAFALGAVWAVVVWNVIVDRIIVIAGRGYVHAAAVAAATSDRYVAADDWMRPAIRCGATVATTAAEGLFAAGAFLIEYGSSGSRTAARERSMLEEVP